MLLNATFIACVTAIGLLMLRMLFLRLHQEYPLLMYWIALDLITGAAGVWTGITSAAFENACLISYAAGLTLPFFITTELFRSAVPNTSQESSRHMLRGFIFSLTFGVAALILVQIYSDTESVRSFLGAVFFIQYIVNASVLALVARLLKMANTSSKPRDNRSWLRFFFAMNLVLSLLQDTLYLFVSSDQAASVVNSIFFILSTVLLLVCLFALRSPRPEQSVIQ